MKRSAFATKLQAAEDACADAKQQIQRLENDNRSLKLVNLRYERERERYLRSNATNAAEREREVAAPSSRDAPASNEPAATTANSAPAPRSVLKDRANLPPKTPATGAKPARGRGAGSAMRTPRAPDASVLETMANPDEENPECRQS